MSELHEIKKGQTGYGVLIENDGFMQISESLQNKKLIESINDGPDGWFVPKPFVVDAVLQKYGIKNANGRIYPEHVLKPEVEKYQRLIAEKMALGECYRPEALILTEEGWKSLEEVKVGENILTLNTETQEIEVKPIIRKIEKDFDGDMINISNRHINDVVTPNHEYVLYDRNGKFKGRWTAQEIMDKKVPSQNKSYIPRKGEWIGKNDEFFIIPNLSSERIAKMNVGVRKKYESDLMLPMKAFAKFMGIYLSEGSCDKGEDGDRVFIYQRKQETVNEIEEMLKELGLPFTKEVNENHEDKKETTTFFISDMRLCAYLKQFGLCYDKYIPFELKQQNKETLTLFYEWFVKGDGRVRGDKRTRTKLTDDVFSTSKRLVLDLNEIQLKIGYAGNYHEEERNQDRYIGERLIEGKNCHKMYFTLRSTVKYGVTLDERFINVNYTPYKGKVMCVEVENHTWYVMDNDKSHWTSNCNHPSDSTIDLGRISHNIVECHWEGHTLIGKLELNISEGFRKHGICSTFGDTCAQLMLQGWKIGISSRGVGEVKQRMGETYVESYELLAFDIVATPSTPGAYLSTDGAEPLRQYVESPESKSILDDKIDAIEKILKG